VEGIWKLGVAVGEMPAGGRRRIGRRRKRHGGTGDGGCRGTTCRGGRLR
jgi:hypothetical protein